MCGRASSKSRVCVCDVGLWQVRGADGPKVGGDRTAAPGAHRRRRAQSVRRVAPAEFPHVESSTRAPHASRLAAGFLFPFSLSPYPLWAVLSLVSLSPSLLPPPSLSITHTPASRHTRMVSVCRSAGTCACKRSGQRTRRAAPAPMGARVPRPSSGRTWRRVRRRATCGRSRRTCRLRAAS